MILSEFYKWPQLLFTKFVMVSSVKDLCANVQISWNFVEFEVKYESLSEEIKIGRLVGRRVMVMV